MIKALLFDADGVLLNGEYWSKHLARDYNVPYDKIEPFFLHEFKDCLEGKVDLKEAIAPYIPKWGWKGSVDELLDYWFKSEHVLDEPLVEYVQGLRSRGIKCYVATNQEKYRAQYMLEKMGFAESFDGVFASCNLGHQKPSKEFFAAVHDKLHDYKLSELLFWDDSEKFVEAARQVGLNAEVYTGFDEFKKKMKIFL